jgi:methyltransferase OMS1
MASRVRLAQRAQLTTHLRCSHIKSYSSSYSRNFTLSTRLAASNPSKRPARTSRPVTLQTPKQEPPPPPPRTPFIARASNEPQTLDVLIKEKKWPLFGAGIAALAIGLYISLVITTTLKDKSEDALFPPCSSHLNNNNTSSSNDHASTPTGLPANLDTSSATTGHITAQAFDKSLNTPEWLMGITGLRKEIAQQARGHVLEIAVGTGRNLAYYGWDEVVAQSQDEGEARTARERERLARLLDQHRLGGPTIRDQQQQRPGGNAAAAVGSLPGEVLSFTGVDVSADMMGVARDRIRGAVPGLDRLMRRRRLEEMPRLRVDEVSDEGLPVVEVLDGRVRLVLGDALRGLPAPPHGSGRAPRPSCPRSRPPP